MSMESEGDRLMFAQLRISAMLSPPSDPLRAEVNEARWADYGRAIHAHMMDPRFVQAVYCALASFDEKGKEPPQIHVARKVRAYLTTGTIA